MKIGYCRVSTKDQNLDLQIAALKEKGCEVIYQEKAGALKKRPECEKMLKNLNSGDILVVYKLDRLGRSLIDLIKIFQLLKEREVEFISISDNIETTTSQGRLMFNIMASFAEYEREMIVERTIAGLRASKNKSGRRIKYKTDPRKLWEMNETMSPYDIYTSLGMSRATYYRILKKIS
jgi:DNA invertase Pin-like site-specific DNA recombinase